MIGFYMIIISMLIFSMKYYHILLSLMILELIMISVSYYMFMYLSLVYNEYFILYYLIFMVCESVLGLAMLVMMVRMHGNDHMKVINLVI